MAVGGAPNTPPNGPPPSVIQTQPPQVRWKTDLVAPPNSPYFQENDFLNISTVGNAIGMQAIFSYRILTPQGEIKEGSIPLLALGGSLATTTFVPIIEGWLLSATLRILNGSGGAFWMYGTIQVKRQQVALGETHGILWQGYISSGQALGTPSGPMQAVTDGYGTLRSITGSVPAAGADINEVVPINRRWNLLAFSANLTTSATVATRQVLAILDDGANRFEVGPSYTGQAASASFGYSFEQSLINAAPTGGNVPLGTPLPIQLRGGFRIKTSTNNIQAGDQWTAPQYLVQEWLQWDN